MPIDAPALDDPEAPLNTLAVAYAPNLRTPFRPYREAKPAVGAVDRSPRGERSAAAGLAHNYVTRLPSAGRSEL